MTPRAASQSLHALRLLACLTLLATGTLAAQDTGWTIDRFQAAYTVRTDRQVDVTERIEVDFGALQKHGIYREIPIRYRKTTGGTAKIPDGTVKVDLAVQSVTDGEGRPIPISVSRGSRVRIRIGDADVTVSGKQVYVIRYRLEGGVGFFDGHDELYWQVTGTEWPVPILEASASITIPLAEAAPTDSAWGAWCYAGWYDSSASDRCTATMTQPGQYVYGSGRLDPGEGLTVVASFPKGIVPAPTAIETAADTVGFAWPIALPLLALLGMFRIWSTRGREPQTGSIVPQWREPQGLRPGIAGTLVDQSADMRDIVATLLDLAVRGYLTIKEVPPDGILRDLTESSFLGKALKALGIGKNDWELERTDKPETDLARFEREVVDGVFEGRRSRRLSDMTNDFYTHIPGIDRAMYDEAVTQGLFERSPDAVRKKWIIIGVLTLVAAVPLGMVTMRVLVGAGVGLSGLIVLGFANVMPAMTPSGARRWQELKGLEEYIKRAEKLELEMHQGPAKDVKLFETLLPYAIALDVSEIWVRQFGPILAAQPPTWYVGMHPGMFNANAFHASLSSFTTAASRTMGSSPGSSSGSGGGGSVGGGGGGGGGGSW